MSATLPPAWRHDRKAGQDGLRFSYYLADPLMFLRIWPSCSLLLAARETLSMTEEVVEVAREQLEDRTDLAMRSDPTTKRPKIPTCTIQTDTHNHQ